MPFRKPRRGSRKKDGCGAMQLSNAAGNEQRRGSFENHASAFVLSGLLGLSIATIFGAELTDFGLSEIGQLCEQ